MSLELQLVGDDQVITRFQSLPNRLREELFASMKIIGFNLQEYIKSNKLSGQVLNRRTGLLSRSVTSQAPVETNGGGTISVSIGANTPYARIQEYGGKTAPHVIEAVNAKALAFRINGTLIFRKRVNHPGSNIPERSYMRSSLAENVTTIRDELAAAVARAANP